MSIVRRNSHRTNLPFWLTVLSRKSDSNRPSIKDDLQLRTRAEQLIDGFFAARVGMIVVKYHDPSLCEMRKDSGDAHVNRFVPVAIDVCKSNGFGREKRFFE
jgi:hypothetical protein